MNGVMVAKVTDGAVDIHRAPMSVNPTLLLIETLDRQTDTQTYISIYVCMCVRKREAEDVYLATFRATDKN